ncbi:MAG TPA: hypothetical protein VKT82_22700 [Ktedonobacterales bacterium]|nr:hypothetical protein [Ktedonobacterales bacterium]
MDILVTIFALVILFSIVAYVAGADSREDWNSPEWERRQHWKGFGGSGN